MRQEVVRDPLHFYATTMSRDQRDQLTAASLALAWLWQNQNWGIVIILLPFSTTITFAFARSYVAPKSRHNSVSHFEIRLNSVFCDRSGTLSMMNSLLNCSLFH